MAFVSFLPLFGDLQRTASTPICRIEMARNGVAAMGNAPLPTGSILL